MYLGKRLEQALYRWPKARVHIIVHFSACLWRRTWYKSKLAYRVGLQGSSLQTISYLFVPASTCIYFPKLFLLASYYLSDFLSFGRHVSEQSQFWYLDTYLKIKSRTLDENIRISIVFKYFLNFRWKMTSEQFRVFVRKWFCPELG